MTLLTKMRTPILTVGLRHLHKTAALKSRVDPPDWDEKKFLEEEKPWLDYSRRMGFGFVGDPHPILKEDYDEPHGKALIPVWWAAFFFGIVPMTIYAAYDEYQHIFVHPHRRPFARLKHEFLHAAGPKKFWFGDGIHTPLHHPYYNFVKEGYETDKDGNMLPKGVYAME